MYDQLILRNDRGNTHTFLFIHGRFAGADVTLIVDIYQSVDNQIFNVSILSEDDFDILHKDLRERCGYFAPGSDTLGGPVVNVESDEDFEVAEWYDEEDPPTFDEDNLDGFSRLRE